MSYQVIARKYRPQRFSDVVGQEHVTQTLANAIQQNRIAHAYLFVGPRGTGKTTLARIFAKCLNCTDGPKVDFSEEDPRCREITEGRSLDVLEIDGASNRGIEEVRELRETVKYAPATSRFKIYIIDEVHMLTKEAFNALLKTLEEPPAHVKFMFATTEPEKVLATILSRCQRFDLRRIPAALIVQHLAHIAGLEQVQVDEAALHAIARGADGGMRDAQSALDQLISFCGNRIEESDVLSMFGLTARSQVFSLSAAIVAGDAEAALRQLDDLARKGKDLARLLADLLNHFRNLLLFQISHGDLTLLEVSEAEAGTLTEQSRLVSTEALTRIMDLLSEYEGRLRDAASKRILVEVALLKAVQAKSSVSIDTVLRKLQQLRAESGTEAAPSRPSGPTVSVARSAAEAPTTASAGSKMPRPQPAPVTPAPVPALAPVSATATPAPQPELTELWGKIVENAGRVSLFVRSYLLEAHLVSLTRNVLTIGFDPEFADHLGLVDNEKNRTLIQTNLQELGYTDVQVKFVQAERPTGWARHEASSSAGAAEATAVSTAPVASAETPAAKAAPAKKEDFKNDPLIKQALEIFKGQIVEVRA
jgi:DNA polymerase III subunit gamma/tau